MIDYDKSSSDYTKYFQNDNVTAVDFVASKTTNTNKQIMFIKVKDMRGNEENNKKKLRNSAEVLTITIAKNIRNTFYGIILGCRKTIATNNTEWKKLNEILVDANNDIKVVLWLEANLSVIPTAPTLHSINRKLKTKLSKLTNFVIVSNRNNPIATITVT